MHDRPTISELLDAVQKFLDEEIVPATKGRRQFLARVAANCVRMVEREIAAEPRHVADAWEGLDGLLGQGTTPEGETAPAESVGRRLELLCERIRAGEIDEGSDQWEDLLAFSRARVRQKLEVSNPKLLAADSKRGIA